MTDAPVQDAPSLDEQLQEFIDSPESVLQRLGLDPESIQSFHLGAGDLLQFIIVTAVAILVLRSIYRGMQHPRLALTYHVDRAPTTSAKAWRRYVWTPIVLLPLWYFSILVILVVAANRGGQLRPPNELIVVAAVVVGASRLLAHVNLEAAHELAKSVPLTLISLILISGQTISMFGSVVLIAALVLQSAAILTALVVLALADVVITSLWWWYRRASWRRGIGDDEAERHLETAVGRTWLRLVQAWGSRSAGPATTAVPPSGRPEHEVSPAGTPAD